MGPAARRFLTMLGLVALVALVASAMPARADTVADVRARGVLTCGVGEIAGLAKRDATGRYVGIRADLCRALAAAVLSDAEAVVLVPLVAGTRFDALKSGEVDVLVAGATWTLGREAGIGLAYTMPNYYDGQGFIAHRRHGWEKLADVDRGRVCVVADTTSAVNLRAHIAGTGQELTPVEVVTREGSWESFLSHSCDLMTNDLTAMVTELRDRAPDHDDYVVFPDLISREPLTPVVRLDDRRWESIVRFTVNALILAEAKGVTAAVARGEEPPTGDDDPEVRRLLGLDPGIGAPVGLDDEWARRAVAAGGNYGEIFDNGLGRNSPYRIDRGLNALWTDGGLHYPFPMH